jgi:hypothetical protein
LGPLRFSPDTELADGGRSGQERGLRRQLAREEDDVAAKHDAKKARANHWVMQQNMAKQKGGRPGFQFSEKKAPRPAKTGAVPARSEAPEADAVPAEDAAKNAPVAGTGDPAG